MLIDLAECEVGSDIDNLSALDAVQGGAQVAWNNGSGYLVEANGGAVFHGIHYPEVNEGGIYVCDLSEDNYGARIEYSTPQAAWAAASNWAAARVWSARKNWWWWLNDYQGGYLWAAFEVVGVNAAVSADPEKGGTYIPGVLDQDWQVGTSVRWYGGCVAIFYGNGTPVVARRIVSPYGRAMKFASEQSLSAWVDVVRVRSGKELEIFGALASPEERAAWVMRKIDDLNKCDGNAEALLRRKTMWGGRL